MSVMLTERNLIQSLASFWGTAFAGNVPTLFPDQEGDAKGWSSWLELQIPWKREESGGQHDLELVQLLLDVHCFVRKTNDLTTMARLVDSVRGGLAGQVIIVRDYGDSVLPAVGVIRVSEAEIRNLGRVERRVLGSDLDHVLVSCRARAQMTVTG